MSSNVTIVGNLTRDPELRFTPAGAPVTTFGVAVNRRWQNRDNQQWEESTSFFNVTCWRDLAQNVSESLEKGARVVVDRPPRAALVGDAGRRAALRRRDRRRRGRPQPALGHRRDQRNERREGAGDGWSGGAVAVAAAAATSPTSRPPASIPPRSPSDARPSPAPRTRTTPAGPRRRPASSSPRVSSTSTGRT